MIAHDRSAAFQRARMERLKSPSHRCRGRAVLVASSSSPDSAPQPAVVPPSGMLLSAAHVVGQSIQVVMANAALVLGPAVLVPGASSDARIWLLFSAYCIFFGLGTLTRIIKHGPLAPRAKDKQVKDLKSKLFLISFIFSMPILHWLPVLIYLRENAPQSSLLRYYKTGSLPLEAQILLDVIGVTLVVSAIALNYAAAKNLGPSYDRLVAPSSLVTKGPYRFIRHPIYSSYGLLFCGFALSLHSLPCAALLVLVCLLYYKQRIWIEEDLLAATFGEQWARYQRETQHLFIPFLF
jgi:protein-S-isoprenylcysteine O-methyltransferase Ste14